MHTLSQNLLWKIFSNSSKDIFQRSFENPHTFFGKEVFQRSSKEVSKILPYFIFNLLPSYTVCSLWQDAKLQ